MMAIQQSPKVQQALSLQKEGRFDAALLVCDEILREEGERADVLHLLGLIAYQTGNTEHAADLIGKATALEPNNTLFHYHRGLAFQKLRNFEAAIVSYDNAIAIKPDNVDALMNRGNALAALGQLDAAIVGYNAVAALRPNVSVIYYNLGQALRERGDLQLAADNLSKAIELNPNFADAHYQLGLALQKMNRLGDAEASFRLAIRLKPDHAEAHSNLGSVLETQGRVSESVISYREAVSLQPDRADAHNKLGKALLDMGCTADAVARLRDAVAAGATHETYSRLIFALDMMSSSDTALLQGERKRWGELFAPPPDAKPFSNQPDPDRRLRVGYVSADFKMHSAAIIGQVRSVRTRRSPRATRLAPDQPTHWVCLQYGPAHDGRSGRLHHAPD